MASQVIVVFLATFTSIIIVKGIDVGNEKRTDGFHNSTVTSVKTVYGDVYDCVDIHKQPSLSHSSLKDHKVQMRPSKQLEEKLAKFRSKKSDSGFERQSLWLKNGCPHGTVPIRRMTQTQVKMARNASRKLQVPSLRWNHGLDFAGLIATQSKDTPYSGAVAYINIYNPSVGPHQFSSASIIVESGDLTNLNQIQVGWIVNPELYGDTRTRLYSSWTADNHRSTGCYNTFCPGFILVNPELPLDYAFPKISKIEGDQFDMELGLMQDETFGAWYLVESSYYTALGYWPPVLFDKLNNYADVVRFGGQVFTPQEDKVSPPMGSGEFHNSDYERTCYMRQIEMALKNNASIDGVKFQGVDSRCYYEGDHSVKSDVYLGFSFLFGGHGGKDESTCVY